MAVCLQSDCCIDALMKTITIEENVMCIHESMFFFLFLCVVILPLVRCGGTIGIQYIIVSIDISIRVLELLHLISMHMVIDRKSVV